jgi:hypothetical protein
VWSAVTGEDLPGFDRFGLPDPPAPGKETSALVAEVIDAILHRIWRRPEIGALALAAMLRPLVPVRPDASLWIDGAPASGKTTIATLIMAGWQQSAGAWGSGVPGSAMSTAASIESALSQAPIWVVDDLAPSSDPNEAARREAVVSNMIRGSFNGAGRERMTRDMKTQRSLRPRAQAIFTSENPLSVSSAESRTIGISMGPDEWLPDMAADGRLGGYALLCEIRGRSNAAALMVAACARAMAEQIAANGYAETRKLFLDGIRGFEETMLLSVWQGDGSQRRAAQNAIGIWSGVMAAVPLLATQTERSDVMEHTVNAICAASHAQSQAARLATPGAALISGLRVALAQQACHLTDLAGGIEKLPKLDGVEPYGTSIGWGHGPGGLRGGGPKIGHVQVKSGVAYAVLEPAAAFEAARKAGGLPGGQKAKASWRAAWNEGLCSGWSRQTSSAYFARIRGESMVPVPLHLLVPSLGAVDDDGAA